MVNKCSHPLHWTLQAVLVFRWPIVSGGSGWRCEECQSACLSISVLGIDIATCTLAPINQYVAQGILMLTDLPAISLFFSILLDPHSFFQTHHIHSLPTKFTHFIIQLWFLSHTLPAHHCLSSNFASPRWHRLVSTAVRTWLMRRRLQAQSGRIGRPRRMRGKGWYRRVPVSFSVHRPSCWSYPIIYRDSEGKGESSPSQR